MFPFFFSSAEEPNRNKRVSTRPFFRFSARASSSTSARYLSSPVQAQREKSRKERGRRESKHERRGTHQFFDPPPKKKMSSLAAARADNFYYPPDHDPRKGSRNTQLGQHHLRERAARLASEGILVVRFELPFNCFCNGCGRNLGQGLRFNADKKQIGSYHSTKVWEFSMSVPCCGTRLVIKTDPKNGDFEVVSGGRRRVVTKRDESESESEESEEEGDGAGPSASAPAAATNNNSNNDAFARAEADFRDRRRSSSSSRKALTVAEQRLRLREISELRAETHGRDYEANKALRALARPARRAAVESDRRRAALGLPESVRLPAEGSRERALAAAAFVAAKRKGKAPALSAVAAASAARHAPSFASQSIFPRSDAFKVKKKVSLSAGGGGAGSSGVVVMKKKRAPS